MTRRRSAILAIALTLGLVLGACGDDSTPSATDDDAGEASESGFTVAVSNEGIEIPQEVTGGVVEVTLEADHDEAEVNFSQVAPTTTEEQFREAIAQTISGGTIPPFVRAETGVLGSPAGSKSTLVLPEGEYIAWAEKHSEEEGEGGEGEGAEGEDAEGGEEDGASTTTSQAPEAGGEGEAGAEGEAGGEEASKPEDILTARFTVTAGEEGDLPEAEGGQITARDYTFDVKVKGGADEFVFRNEGPDQFHHVVLFNFGDLEPSVVEENLPAFFASEEGAPPPPAFNDVDFENLEAGGSTVLSPGLGATASAKLEPGSTYAAVCFINDRTGGPPHAIGKGMHTVFTVA